VLASYIIYTVLIQSKAGTSMSTISEGISGHVVDTTNIEEQQGLNVLDPTCTTGKTSCSINDRTMGSLLGSPEIAFVVKGSLYSPNPTNEILLGRKGNLLHLNIISNTDTCY